MLGLGLSLTGGAVSGGGVSPSLDLDFMAGTMPAAVTFSRTSTATRYTSAGVLETVAAGVPRFDHDPAGITNLLTQSIGLSTWGGASMSRTLNAGVAPDGTMTASRFVAIGTSNTSPNHAGTAITSGAPHTFSVHFKRETAFTWARLRFEVAGSIRSVFFNLDTGATGQVDTPQGNITALSAAPAVSLGGGWWRLGATITGTGTSITVAAAPAIANASASMATGDTWLMCWAQIESGSTMNRYVPTTTAPASYFAPRGLLVEEARTNLIAGQMSNATYWPAVSISRGTGATAPDGTASTLFTENAGGAASYGANAQNVAITAGSPITGSVYAKAGTCTWLRVLLADSGIPTTTAQAYFNIATGTVGAVTAGTVTGGTATGISAAIQNCGNGWYRCTLTATLAAHATCSLLLRMVSADASNTDTGGNTMNFHAPQLEAGAFATSPILTTTAAATRAAEAAVVNDVSWFNPSAGTLAVEATRYTVVKSGTNFAVMSDGTTGNLLGFLNGAATPSQHRTTIVAGGVTQADLSLTATATADAIYKEALAYAANDAAACMNGGAVVTDATVTLPTGLNRLQIGGTFNNAVQIAGHIRRIRVWRVRRPNADLQQITAI